MPSFRDQVNKARPAAGAPGKSSQARREEINDIAEEMEKLIRQYILNESRKIPKSQKLRITGCVKCQLNREASDTPNDHVVSVNGNNHNPLVDVRGEGFKGSFLYLLAAPHAIHTFTVTAAGGQVLEILRARLEPDGIRLGQWSVASGSCSAHQLQTQKAGYYPFLCGPEEECFTLPASIRDDNSANRKIKVVSGGVRRTATGRGGAHHLCLPFVYE